MQKNAGTESPAKTKSEESRDWVLRTVLLILITVLTGLLTGMGGYGWKQINQCKTTNKELSDRLWNLEIEKSATAEKLSALKDQINALEKQVEKQGRELQGTIRTECSHLRELIRQEAEYGR